MLRSLTGITSPDWTELQVFPSNSCLSTRDTCGAAILVSKQREVRPHSCFTVSGGGDQRVCHLVFEDAGQLAQFSVGCRRTLIWKTTKAVTLWLFITPGQRHIDQSELYLATRPSHSCRDSHSVCRWSLLIGSRPRALPDHEQQWWNETK